MIDAKQIKLTEDVFFQFDDINVIQNQREFDFLGWEFTRGRLRIRQLDALFPKNNIVFLPCFGADVGWAALLKSLFFKTTSQFDKVIVDWPPFFQNFTKQIVASFPENLCLSPADETQTSIIEALDNNRIALFQIAESDPKIWDKIQCSGAAVPWRTTEAETSRQCILALKNGIIPFLHLAFSQTKPKENVESLYNSVLNYLKQNSEQKILVLLSVEMLFGFVTKLSDALADADGSPEKLLKTAMTQSLNEARKTIVTQQKLALERLDATSASDIVENCGFIVKEFIASRDELGIEIFRKGFAKGFQAAAQRYADWTRLSISQAQERNTFRFAYRLAKENGALLPNTFEMVLAVQSVIDSNFAFEFLKECRDFPENPKFSSMLPLRSVSLESLFKNVAKVSVRRFETLQRRRLQSKKVLKASSTPRNHLNSPQPVSEEKYADNKWVNEDHPYSCSFPSEDVFMENFAFQCRDTAIEKIKAQQTVVTELSSTLGEGIDIRETVRNWHSQKIMIREELMVGKADVGSVIFNFIEDSDAEIYSWKTLWLAEHHDKSHLMFYATPFAQELIGPGIAKSEFGGFAVIPIESYPVDAWNDPFLINFCNTPAEMLVVAGALVTEHKAVLFISPHPPAQKIVDLLKRSGRTIIYQPLSEISSESIRRIRTFHILAEAGVRGYADKYIRKD